MLHPLTSARRAAYVLVISLLVSAYFASIAPAQRLVCAPHQVLASAITERLDAERIGLGIADSNVLVELYVADDGDWVLLAVGTNKRTCIVGAGRGWEQLPMRKGQAS